MTAPLCLHCGVKPVARRSTKGQRHRLIDGVRWGCYCSRRCTGLAFASVGALAAYNRARSAAYYALLIEDVVGSRWRSGHPVTTAQLVQIARAAWKTGYNAAYQRDRRTRQGRAA